MTRIETLPSIFATALSYCRRHGVWFGDKYRPSCPECEAHEPNRALLEEGT